VANDLPRYDATAELNAAITGVELNAANADTNDAGKDCRPWLFNREPAAVNCSGVKILRDIN
jgi:hypothetical protein